jgi:hypothetical protein
MAAPNMPFHAKNWTLGLACGEFFDANKVRKTERERAMII